MRRVFRKASGLADVVLLEFRVLGLGLRGFGNTWSQVSHVCDAFGLWLRL